jgi:hypothetical protein
MRGVMGQVQLSLSHKPVQALRRCATNNGCDCAPLGGHELGKVQQLFIFITGPLGLLDAGVEPLIPASAYTHGHQPQYVSRVLHAVTVTVPTHGHGGGHDRSCCRRTGPWRAR